MADERGIPARPRTEQLETFLAVVDAGGLGGAARALGIPKSTVSRRISSLEALLGVRLLVRTTRKVSITDAGARVLERVRQLLADVDAVMDVALGTPSDPRGLLKVTAPDDLTAHRDIWVDFMERFPGVELHVEFTNRHVDVVREGLDLALRAGPGDDLSLVGRRVGAYALWAVATPGWVDVNGRQPANQDLRAHDRVMLKPFGTSSRPSDAGPRQLVANDLTTVHAAVLRGLGIGVLPEVLVAGDLDQGRLVPAHDAYAPFLVPLYAVYPGRRHLPAPAVAFIEHVRTTCAAHEAARAGGQRGA